ncbi:MAG: cation:proton antiporter [Actinomycetota bacterium]
MNFERFLLYLIVILVVARIAAEIAERIGQPAVLLEIIAGILIGPSLLGFIPAHEEVLEIIAELGAILLLFEVGIQMDLKGLTRVGRDSLLVAIIGIAFPMAGGYLAMRGMGVEQGPAIFLAGGITATSVGITARVFGDLKALATAEARTVLGAAVADDVGGLLILTLVGALAAGEGVSAADFAGIAGIALGFLVVAGAAAIWVGPRLLNWISKLSRTEGTVMVVGLAFAFSLSWASSAVRLAPIVGAFLAGLALSESNAREELRRRLVPIVHLLVPAFFLLIGVKTDLGVFANPQVLVLTGVLCAVAIAGKLGAGLGVRGSKADRTLVGVAMIPRGEVGLIFAGLGLAAGALDATLYGVLVAVVIITTLIAPPWIRQRIVRTRKRALKVSSAAVEPEGGWLQVDEDKVELIAEPPDLLAPIIGLETAIACASRRPGSWLMQWLASAEAGPPVWDDGERERFLNVMRYGNERSWRFLEVTGFLHAYLPILDEALNHRRKDQFELDPAGALRFEVLEELQRVIHETRDEAVMVWERLAIKDIVLLAALGISAFEGDDAAAKTADLARTIGFNPEKAELAGFLAGESALLPAASRRLDMTGEDFVLELASHVETSERADALYVLAVAGDAFEPWQRESLDELFDLLQSALTRVEKTGRPEIGPVELRRREIIEALPHLDRGTVARHLEAAPRRYLVAHGPKVIARHLKMTETPLGRDEVRLEAEPSGIPGQWVVHIATRDRRGVLAAIAGVFATRQMQVKEAFISTWRDGTAIDVFKVTAPPSTSWDNMKNLLAHKLANPWPNGGPAGIEGIVEVDNLASPWHSIVEIRAPDRGGLLYRVASALSAAGLDIHMAVVDTAGDVAVDVFYVTGRRGSKLDEKGERDLRLALAGKPLRRWTITSGLRRKSQKQAANL